MALTRMVAIINLTPDSFSDGGAFLSDDHVFARMEACLDMGAQVLDVGAESTRPGATPLSYQEEWERLKSILPEAKKHFPDTILSVDTRHSETAKRALDAGADWINDVSGGADEAMWPLIAQSRCRYVVMHSLSVPANPAITLPAEEDPVQAITRWHQAMRQKLMDAGIAEQQVIFDPGVGFGKTRAQSWQLLQNMPSLLRLGGEWLVGHSRKSFLAEEGKVMNMRERDLATHPVSAMLAKAGVHYIRVHDVAGTCFALHEALRKMA